MDNAKLFRDVLSDLTDACVKHFGTGEIDNPNPYYGVKQVADAVKAAQQVLYITEPEYS